jgi:hypothetical protein
MATMEVHSLSVEGRSISSLLGNNNQVIQKFFSSNLFGKKKKKAGFLIIQNLIKSYVWGVVISYILLFSTKILIYWQRDEEIDSSFHSNRFKNKKKS